MRSTFIVIINAAAGTGHESALADKLTAIFAANGAAAEIVLAHGGNEIIGSARAAVAQRPDAVVAGGGDGTISAVASMLVGTGMPLGVLPLGTLNHFAKDMGVPAELDAAVRAIVHGNVKRIDVGEVNQRIFLNNSSLGIYPDIVREREKQQRRLGRGKWLSFGWATLATLRAYPFLHVHMEMASNKERPSVNGAGRMWKTPFVFIGNNEYLMEGFRIGERAALDRGMLSVYVAQRTGRWGLLRLAMHALFGRLDQVKDFNALRTTEMRIESRHRRLRVATDGEVTVMNTPLHYKIRAGALQVIVPDEDSAADPGTV